MALADKLDTLRGCFGVGLIPTGSRDPFALRRAAQGVVKILVEGKLEIPLLPLLEGNAELQAFFEDRIRFYFKDIRGFAYDEVNAAMAAGWSNLVDLEARLARIQSLRHSADFEPLAASFKRIRNILEQAQLAERSGCPPTNRCSRPDPKRISTRNRGASPASRLNRPFPGCAPRSICFSTKFW